MARALPPALVRHVGRRIEASNLLAGWDPAPALRADGIPVDVVTDNGPGVATKIVLVFRDARTAGRVFGALLNDGAYGLDPHLPNNHEFRSAKLSGLVG